MNVIYKLDRARHRLFDARGLLLDPPSRCWSSAGPVPDDAQPVDATTAVCWLQRESGMPVRIPVGVIGPREASTAQLSVAEALGYGLAGMGLTVLCGGRQGIMEAACRGVSRAGGLAVGLLPEGEPAHANPHVGLILATGIGEARNALIARASLCLVAVGDSYGTLSEVALGLQFGKRVFGLEDAARVPGVLTVDNVAQALEAVAAVVLERK